MNRVFAGFLAGFILTFWFCIKVMMPAAREDVFEHFFFKRSQCLSCEAYTNGKETWVVQGNREFVYVKGAPEPCGENKQ